MLASAVQMGFFAWAFYAAQPYLLELLGSDAIWVSGLVAAGVALSTMAGNQVVAFASRYCGRRTTLLLGAAAVQSARGRRPRADGLVLGRARRRSSS